LAEGAANIVKPWDKKGFRLPGGNVQSRRHGSLFMGVGSRSSRQDRRALSRAAAIMESVYDGCMLTSDTGLKIENRQFARLAVSPQAQNMIRTLFYAIGDANKLIGRPAAVPGAGLPEDRVLGAGMMARDRACLGRS